MLLSTEFIDGFTQSNDKMAFLTLSGFPNEIKSKTGGPSLKLVNTRIETNWQLGTASPSFGRQELTYLPYPKELVTNVNASVFFLYTHTHNIYLQIHIIISYAHTLF